MSVNVVPDFCEIEIDRRLIPGRGSSGMPAAARTDAGERLGSLEGVESTVTVGADARAGAGGAGGVAERDGACDLRVDGAEASAGWECRLGRMRGP